jgi:phage tail sheath protein FI
MSLSGVSVGGSSADPLAIEGVETSITGLVGLAGFGPVNKATEIRSFADFEDAFGPLDPSFPLTYAVQQFFVNGGRRAYVVRATSEGDALAADAVLGAPGARTGIYALEDLDPFNLLVLPDSAAADSSTVIAAALAYCEQRRAFMVVDPPSQVSTFGQAKAWIEAPGTPRSANGAAYFPRPQSDDAPVGDLSPAPSCAGAIAGLYARTDATRGVWSAPAGTEASLTGPTSLGLALTDLESQAISAGGLNPLRLFASRGIVVWGARTLLGSDETGSEWKYVPVRRTALFIEESVEHGTQWAAFEPNGEPLWAQIRLSVSAFLHDLFQRGAFQGASPSEAYFVKCDAETTTLADINLGVVNLLVGFAPLRPAEFVLLRISQRAQAGAMPTDS